MDSSVEEQSSVLVPEPTAVKQRRSLGSIGAWTWLILGVLGGISSVASAPASGGTAMSKVFDFALGGLINGAFWALVVVAVVALYRKIRNRPARDQARQAHRASRG